MLDAACACAAVLNDLSTPLQFTINIHLLSLNKVYRNATASACAAELKPVQVLNVKAPQNFAKWVWTIPVADLLKLQPGCTRTTCYVHADTTVAAQLQSDGQDLSTDATAGPTPSATLVAAASSDTVRVSSVAEPAAPVAFWPQEGVSGLQHNEAAAALKAEGPDSMDGSTHTTTTAAQWGPGSVPDVQLLLASPRSINFQDPQLQVSLSPTAAAGGHTY